MSLLPALNPKPFPPTLSTTNPKHLFSFFFISPSTVKPHHALHLQPLRAISSNPDSTPNNPNPKPKPKPKPRARRSKPKTPQTDETETKSEEKPFLRTIPRKPRRGRRSEATAVEDYIRNTLEQTFESIRNQSSEVSEDMEKVLKEKENDDSDDEDDGDGKKKKKRKSKKKKDVVDEEDPNWPLDADVGWGIRASEYFDKHPIKNVVGDDGVEIDWEGEIEDNFVNEIDCLEWERFAYHPSPLIVLVFERYNRATDNWKLLKELEKAIKVYWDAKDRLPPRTVKIDINIERDLAYALKVRECPQLLFLKGNKILYREKGIRTSDELIQMIAHFYYNAKKPSCIDDTALAPPY